MELCPLIQLLPTGLSCWRVGLSLLIKVGRERFPLSLLKEGESVHLSFWGVGWSAEEGLFSFFFYYILVISSYEIGRILKTNFINIKNVWKSTRRCASELLKTVEIAETVETPLILLLKTHILYIISTADPSCAIFSKSRRFEGLKYDIERWQDHLGSTLGPLGDHF